MPMGIFIVQGGSGKQFFISVFVSEWEKICALSLNVVKFLTQKWRCDYFSICTIFFHSVVECYQLQ